MHGNCYLNVTSRYTLRCGFCPQVQPDLGDWRRQPALAKGTHRGQSVRRGRWPADLLRNRVLWPWRADPALVRPSLDCRHVASARCARRILGARRRGVRAMFATTGNVTLRPRGIRGVFAHTGISLRLRSSVHRLPRWWVRRRCGGGLYRRERCRFARLPADPRAGPARADLDARSPVAFHLAHCGASIFTDA